MKKPHTDTVIVVSIDGNFGGSSVVACATTDEEFANAIAQRMLAKPTEGMTAVRMTGFVHGVKMHEQITECRKDK
jgi:DNA/RNA endonuclease YhcR with UshA esterase domain